MNEFLIAASMENVFKCYENKDSKCREFKTALPNDAKLHRFSRQKDFVMELNNFLNVIAQIPDDIADTESNLKPVILRKIMFRLGFDISIVNNYESSINKLLEYRNAIAHGNQRKGIDNKTYEKIEKETLKNAHCKIIKR